MSEITFEKVLDLSSLPVELVSKLPIEQTPLWGEFQAITYRRRHLGFYKFIVNGKLLAVADLVEAVQRFYTYTWCKNGPIFFGDTNPRERAAILKLIARIVKIESPKSDFIRYYGYVELKSPTSPAFGYHIKHTLVATTTPTIDEFIPTMTSKKARKTARRSLREDFNIVIFDGTQLHNFKKDLDAFYKLWQLTAHNKGFNVHHQNYIEKMLSVLGQNCVMVCVYQNKELLSGRILTIWGQTATAYYSAASRDGTVNFAGTRGALEAIVEANHRGASRYDFLGIETSANSRLSSVTEFKMKFSQNIVELPPVTDLLLKPIKYKITKLLYKIVR